MIDQIPPDSEGLSEDTNSTAPQPAKPALPWHRKLLNYLKQLALIEAILCLLAGFTFIFTGRLSLIAYSERLFYIGVFVTLVGGFVAVAIMLAGASVRFTKPEQARQAWDTILERRQIAEKRYDASIQVWLIGAVCIALSALLQVISARFGL